MINKLTSHPKNNASVKELKLTRTLQPILTSFPMHLMTTFQQLEPNLLMRYPLLLTVQVMPFALLAATTSSYSVQLVVAMFFSLLNKLSKSKATGLNNISGKLIRESADLISIPLCNIFNKSLSSGFFPENWRRA